MITVLPMYMGVILGQQTAQVLSGSAPHVYGGDPTANGRWLDYWGCSPCIWG